MTDADFAQSIRDMIQAKAKVLAEALVTMQAEEITHYFTIDGKVVKVTVALESDK